MIEKLASRIELSQQVKVMLGLERCIERNCESGGRKLSKDLALAHDVLEFFIVRKILLFNLF